MHASTEGVASLAVGGVTQRFRWIPPGAFLMGSPADEEGLYDDEGPQRRVEITQGFWLGETTVTQALWEAVMGGNPSRFEGPDRPVEQVSWRDCQEFIARLGALGVEARLPTEAEWEYACRAGTTGPTYAPLDAVAWHEGNSGGGTRPVGQLAPNAFGLYDMLGNVWEWCADWHGAYAPGDQRDTEGPVAGDDRVVRGGSWGSTAWLVRAAYRYGIDPGFRGYNLGFRLARGPGTGEWAEPGTRSGPEPVEGHPRTKGDTMHARTDTHERTDAEVLAENIRRWILRVAAEVMPIDAALSCQRTIGCELNLGIVSAELLAALPGERHSSVYEPEAILSAPPNLHAAIDSVTFVVGGLRVRVQGQARAATDEEIAAWRERGQQ